MANRTNPIHEAVRQFDWQVLETGRELRLARIRCGRTQREVGAAAGRSASYISRVERGRVRRVRLPDLVVIAAAVGLKLYVKTYPGGRRPVDAAQLGLLAEFNQRLHPRWQRRIEAVIPMPGDIRAVDELICTEVCSCATEAVTRLADVQAQVRAARVKQRDIGADRLIMLIRGSHANRRMLHEAGPVLLESFPIGTRQALRSLAAGRDPGGDCLIVM